jgi:transcriptional regulator with PAS, ATPase and Fis domain
LQELCEQLRTSRWDQYMKVRYHLTILSLLEGGHGDVAEAAREMLDDVRKTASALPDEYRSSFMRHPVPKGIIELSVRVGLAKALRDLAPEDALHAVEAFSDIIAKPSRKPSRIRAGKSAAFELVYESSEMRQVVETATQIARSEMPLLIIGETGVGKEMLARYIAHLSEREGQFVPLNCAAVPASLMESELFGYARGAFTGADRDKKGLFLTADKGTLFLDEIGNMPAEMQAKLLRVLEENRVRPLGSTKENKVRFRLLSATNRDLREDVEKGRFREDLYYRINVVTIKLPPLRDRRDDIRVLIDYFLGKWGPDVRMEQDALAALVKYDWPGNVRELKNEITRLVSMSGGSIEKRMLKEEILRPTAQVPAGGAIQDMERKMIEDALKATGYNKQKVAKLLGISRTTLYRKMKRYKINRTEA